MDLMTLFGLLGAVALLVFGIAEGGGLAAFLNVHGIVIVLGGTLFSTMINSSAAEMVEFFKAALSLLFKPKLMSLDETVSRLVALATKARQSGVLSLQDEAKDVADDGFIAHAIEVCLTSNDERVARVTLEKEINLIRLRHREVGNIFRTAGLLSPMFGLLGTLIGIISVLKNIAAPESVGPAMATAISSAFYGILVANLLFVPGAGKLRTRSLQELLSKEIVMEGLLDVVFSDKIPVIIEMRLLPYLQADKSKGDGMRAASPVSDTTA